MLNIPTRLNELLQRNQTLHSYVLGAAATIAPWARDNKTVFFPEYTDHSLIHLNEVIATADSLISDAAWPHLTTEDAAASIVSVLLHDCALHLSEDGFFELISGSYRSPPSRYGCKDPPWPLLWSEFYAEARRFDQRKLKAIFGDTEPVLAIPKDKLSFTLRHRLLIGEFLRRHHARLGHEIALAGIPGPDGRRVPVGIGSPDFMDLCGFIARSHNLRMRTAVDALRPDKHRIHQNCHVPFVMGVLRISDFIQIHSARAPEQLLCLKALTSPISRGEWGKHAAILELHQAHDDPEAIYVDAAPPNVATFLSLTSLFSDIQAELDQVWAVLGETYGRLGSLNSLGITVRRIRSSIDDPDAFASRGRIEYVPRRFRFRTASAELMDLLVVPLYGARPAIGVRELVQNAVDACLERDDLLEKERLSSTNITTDLDVMVTLIVRDGQPAKLIVEDYGVGMTVDVIDNYFLNIGASFRSSDIWRMDHERDGHSTVHRTGRFGVGVLAAFLLGDELAVTTSHISANGAGFTFTCRRGDESIEITEAEIHHGTRIEVTVSPSVASMLVRASNEWDWFCIDKPKVIRTILGASDRRLPQTCNVPRCNASLDGTSWHRLRITDFDDVLWTHEHMRHGHETLICNGIRVTSSLYEITPNISPGLDVIAARAPSLVVFDPDGRLPINLQRSALAGALPFQEELTCDVARKIAARMLDCFKDCPRIWEREHVRLAVHPRIKGFGSIHTHPPSLAPVAFTKDGVLPVDLSLLRMRKPGSILIDPTDVSRSVGNWSSRTLIDSVDCYIAMDPINATKYSRVAFMRGVIEASYRSSHFLGNLPLMSMRIMLQKSQVAELVAPGKVPRKLWNKLHLEHDNSRWGLWSHGVVPALHEDFASIVSAIETHKGFGFAIFYLEWDHRVGEDTPGKTSPFCQAWLDAAQGPVLPFSDGGSV